MAKKDTVKAGFWNCCQERPTKAVMFINEETGEEVWHKACAGDASTVARTEPERVRDYTPNAHEKRVMGMQDVNRKVFNYNGDMAITDREEIALLIETLLPLGRTQKCQNCIKAWARLVRSAEDTDALRFNFIQWGVYANFEA